MISKCPNRASRSFARFNLYTFLTLFLRRQAAKHATIPAMLNSAKVPGSGTAATTGPGEAASDEASHNMAPGAGSRTNIPPAPTVKLVPSARALEFVR